MDSEKIAQMINSVGFPIVMCGALFYTNMYVMNQQSVLLTEFKEALNLSIRATEKRNERAEYAINKIDQLDAKINLMGCK